MIFKDENGLFSSKELLKTNTLQMFVPCNVIAL